MGLVFKTPAIRVSIWFVFDIRHIDVEKRLSRGRYEYECEWTSTTQRLVYFKINKYGRAGNFGSVALPRLHIGSTTRHGFFLHYSSACLIFPYPSLCYRSLYWLGRLNNNIRLLWWVIVLLLDRLRLFRSLRFSLYRRKLETLGIMLDLGLCGGSGLFFCSSLRLE